MEAVDPVRINYVLHDQRQSSGDAGPPRRDDVGLRFLPSDAVESAANNPLLSSFNLAFSGRVTALVARLHAYQDQVLEHIGENEANANRFVEDPLAVMVEVCRIPADLEAEIRAIREQWPGDPGANPP